MIGDVRLDMMALEAPALALLGRAAIFGESMRRILHTMNWCCLFCCCQGGHTSSLRRFLLFCIISSASYFLHQICCNIFCIKNSASNLLLFGAGELVMATALENVLKRIGDPLPEECKEKHDSSECNLSEWLLSALNLQTWASSGSPELL